MSWVFSFETNIKPVSFAKLSKEEVVNEISDKNENIYGFPLDVTDKSECKNVFEKIKNKFQNVEICFFPYKLKSLIFDATPPPYIADIFFIILKL